MPRGPSRILTKLLAVTGFGALLCPIACLPPLAPHAQPGPGWPDLAQVPPGTSQGKRDAAVIVSLDSSEAAGRDGARELGDAWARELVERQGVPARRVWLLRDGRATAARVRRVLERARRRVPTGGSLWFVFVGRGNTSSPDQPGELLLAPHRKGSSLRQIEVWATLGFGPQHSAFAVLDACDDRPAAGQLGGLPALRLEWRGEAQLAIVMSPQDRSLLAGGGGEGTKTERTEAAAAPPTPKGSQGTMLGILVEQAKREAMRDSIRQRREPANLASMSAGVGPGCAAVLPLGEGPALSYAMLGALRGWGDVNADGRITAEEATEYVGQVVRHGWSPGEPVPNPEAAGINLVLSDSSGQPAPALSAIVPAAASPEERAALPPLRMDFDPVRHVPASSFALGCRAQSEGCEADEVATREAVVFDYTMDRTEVSWDDYADCVVEGGCKKINLDRCYVFQPDTGFVEGGGLGTELISGDRPVVCATWAQAEQYCQWRGQRLPTEPEWEKAARGTDGRRYPWGDEEPTCTLAHHHGCGAGTTPVGSHPEGASPYGMLDMAGNVWEWTQDWYATDAYERLPTRRPPTAPEDGRVKVVRGGSFYDDIDDLRSSYRYGLTPSHGYSTVGFRCAR